MIQPNFTNKVLLVVKAGDQPNAKGFKNNELVEIIDPTEWGKTPILSDNMGKVFRLETRPRSAITTLRQVIEDNKGFKEAGLNKRILLSDTDKIYNIAREKWLTKEVAPIVDATVLEDSGVITKVLTPKIKDINAITSGNYTVGSGGTYDYLTFNTFEADLATLTANITATQQTDLTETQSVWNTDTAGYKIRLDCANPHSGDITAGNKINSTRNDTVWHFNLTGAGTLEICNINFSEPSIVGASPSWYVYSTAITSFLCHDNILKGGDTSGGRGIQCSGTGFVSRIYNNIVTKFQYGQLFLTGSASNRVENNTVYGCGNGMFGANISAHYNNNACYDNTSADFTNMGTNNVGKNNYSSDTTAGDFSGAGSTGNVINKLSADAFLSTDDTSSDFLDIKESGDLDGSGITNEITERTTGIRDRAVTTPPSVGAAEVRVRTGDGIAGVSKIKIGIGIGI